MDRHDKKYATHDKKPYSRDDKSRDHGHRDRHRDRSNERDRRRDHSDDRDRDYSKQNDKRDRDREDRGGSRHDNRNKDYRKHDDSRNREYGKIDYNKYIKKEIKEEEVIEKEKPSLELSGALLKDTNMYNGIVVLYSEPPEARKPKKRWRLYVFKGESELPFYPMHRQSAYLFGRERKVADIPVDHPSCSKQHAAFQYRLVNYTKADGSTGRTIKPYIIDLGSTNGTFINNEQIEAKRYYELKEKDVIKFGFSSREYVLLHEESKGDEDIEYNSDSEEEEDKGSPIDLKNERLKG